MKRKLLIILSAIFVVAVCGLCVTACEDKKDEVKSIIFMNEDEVYHTYSTKGYEYIDMPQNPQKDGYMFDGWYVDKDSWNVSFNVDAYIDKELRNDLHVFAKWISIMESVFDYADRCLTIDLSVFQNYENADLTKLESGYYNDKTGLFTVPSSYNGNKIEKVKIKAAYGKLDSNKREITTKFNNFAIAFEQGWHTGVNIELSNISFSAPDGMSGIDLSVFTGNNINLEVTGKVKIAGGKGISNKPDGCNGIDAYALTVSGDGYLAIYGGDGLNGDLADSVSDGSIGGNSIRVCNLTVECENLFAYGGNGGDGCANEVGVGYSGGDGGNAIYVERELTLNETNLQTVGGSGGNGGNGGKGKTGYTGTEHKFNADTRRGGSGSYGYKGGKSGKGGFGLFLETSEFISVNNSTVVLKGGDGGVGGIGGAGGDGGNGANGWWAQYNGAGGDGGNGGDGGDAYCGQNGCNLTDIAYDVIIQSGKDGVVGSGGVGGNTGSDGSGGWNTDNVTKYKGSQGSKGKLLSLN